MSNAETLMERVASLQQRRDLLEKEARQHEAAARQKRAERDQVKADLAELHEAVHKARVLDTTQRTLQAAEAAKQLAESKGVELSNELERVKALREELDKKLAEMQEVDTSGDS